MSPMKNGAGNMRKLAYCLALLLFCYSAFFFTVKSKEGPAQQPEAIEEDIPFATTTSTERKGTWFGGVPQHNKRASKINTYYRIKAAAKANHLSVTLRFEGVTQNDAIASFRPIDGAKFEQADQQNVWRLKPNIASQVTFTVVVPDNISYLTLHTSQGGNGASRAFTLEKPIKHKKH